MVCGEQTFHQPNLRGFWKLPRRRRAPSLHSKGTPRSAPSQRITHTAHSTPQGTAELPRVPDRIDRGFQRLQEQAYWHLSAELVKTEVESPRALAQRRMVFALSAQTQLFVSHLARSDRQRGARWPLSCLTPTGTEQWLVAPVRVRQPRNCTPVNRARGATDY